MKTNENSSDLPDLRRQNSENRAPSQDQNEHFTFDDAVEVLRSLAGKTENGGGASNQGMIPFNQQVHDRVGGPMKMVQAMRPEPDSDPDPLPMKHYECSICNKSLPEECFKKVSMPEEKLIFMTWKLIENQVTIDEAKLFFNGSPFRKYVCRIHFTESIRRIFQEMGIESIGQITFESAQKLMRTVKLVKMDTKVWDFCNYLNNFVIRNTERVRVRDPPKYRKPTYFKCALCQERQERQFVKSVTIKNELLILLIGRFLRNEIQLNNAKNQFISTDYAFVCHTHFYETIEEIFKVFDLNNPERSLAESSFKTLMVSVKQVCSYMTDENFVEEFLQFGKRAKKMQK